MGADFIGDLVFQAAGVRLLFVEVDLRQSCEDEPALYFQLTRQIVDPNPTH
jgi:hypothetical protein